MDQHEIDISPLLEDETPRYINEPWLVDDSICFEPYADQQRLRHPEYQPDNIRV